MGTKKRVTSEENPENMSESTHDGQKQRKRTKKLINRCKKSTSLESKVVDKQGLTFKNKYRKMSKNRNSLTTKESEIHDSSHESKVKDRCDINSANHDDEIDIKDEPIDYGNSNCENESDKDNGTAVTLRNILMACRRYSADGSRSVDVTNSRHRKTRMKKETSTTVRNERVSCFKCKKNLSSLSTLRRHAKKYHPDDLEIVAPTKQPLFSVVKCRECKSSFSKKSNYRHHVRKFHPELIDELAPPKNVFATVTCSECHKSFTKISNYRRHVRKFHADKAQELAPRKCYAFHCETCGKNFSHLKHFRFHKKKVHLEIDTVEKREKKKCPLCEYTTIITSDILEHFQQNHDISVVYEKHEFGNESEFLLWKSNIEKTTMASFVKKHGSYIAKTYQRTAYVCHRSGYFVSKGKGLRHLKRQGSSKSNAFCPAFINVTIKANIYEVNYCKTHVGHDRDLGHLSLTLTERQELAAKIAAKIPFSAILDEVRDSISKCRLERVHLLTKKDLYNIERCFKLKSTAVRSRNTAATIKAWIHEMENNGCVLFYKTMGITNDTNFEKLTEDDFVLIIMTQGQEEMLNKYGNDCICVDRTHELGGNNYELFTLLVLDELREGFPCSFLISNRQDDYVMQLFFNCIAQKLGTKLKPKVFMSDMPEIFYDAWLMVMHPAEYRLFCAWHVDKTWREVICKINSKEKQISIYRKLRTLLHEPVVDTFLNMAQQFMFDLSTSTDTYDFGQYFNLNYMNNVEAWAYCYRIYNGLNTSMHIERVHKTIKYLYLSKKYRLDKSLNSIMKFVKDKLYNRLSPSNKGKLGLKVKDIRSRHEVSLHLDLQMVLCTEIGWEVQSDITDEVFLIEENKSECECKLICPDCKVCIHKYTCTCLDSNIKWNMCKHIHLICRYRQTQHIMHDDYQVQGTAPELGDNSTTNCNYTPALEMPTEVNHVFIHSEEEHNSYNTFTEVEHEATEYVNSFTETQHNQYKLDDEKQKLKMSLMSVVDSIDSITNLEEIEALKALLSQIETTLATGNPNNISISDKCSKQNPDTSKPPSSSAVVQLINL